MPSARMQRLAPGMICGTTPCAAMSSAAATALRCWTPPGTVHRSSTFSTFPTPAAGSIPAASIYGSIGMNTTRLCRKCFLTDMGSKTDAGSRSRSIPWSRRWLHNFGRTTWATFLTSLTDRICPITMRMKSGSLSAAPPPSVPPTQFWNAAACTRRADSTITISSPSLISIRQMPYLFSEPPSARSASAF